MLSVYTLIGGGMYTGIGGGMYTGIAGVSTGPSGGLCTGLVVVSIRALVVAQYGAVRSLTSSRLPSREAASPEVSWSRWDSRRRQTSKRRGQLEQGGWTSSS